MRVVPFVALVIGCVLPITEVCPSRAVTRVVHVESDDRVDLLFVVDRSLSMVEEQPSVAAELERMVRVLSTGDRDLDGVLDFIPVRSLHVGVVSSDLGGPGCVGEGDDAILVPGCSVPERIFRFGFDPPVDEDALAAEVGCTVRSTSTGCGIEQPLEATLRALSPSNADARVAPSYAPPSGATLQGDGANAGFLREGSVLAVVIATDEDDCSLAGDGAPAPDDDTPDGCLGRPLQPLDRYEDGLAQLRPSPGWVLLLVLAAVPPNLVTAGASYEQMLADPRMAETRDGSGLLAPSCEGASRRGVPPRRLVELAARLRDRGVVTSASSVCVPGSSSLLVDAFPPLRRRVSTGICLPEPIDAPDEACRVELRLPAESEREASRRCATLGFELLGIEGGRERCAVPRVDPARWAPGWVYWEGDSATESLCGEGTSRAQLVELDHLTDVDLTVRCQLSIPEGGPPSDECTP